LDNDWLILFAGIALGGLIVYFVTKTGVVSGRAIVPIASNKEVWQWTDFHGNKREIAVHREVKG